MNILHQIPTDAKIRRIIKKIVFGQHLFCPYCGSRSIKKYEQRYFCKRCRKKFSLLSVTWLKGMKMPLAVFWLLLWCWTNKTPLDQTKKVTGLSEPTIRTWYDKFRNHLPKDELADMRLEGKIQMDEAYRGAKNSKYAIIGAKQINQDKEEKRKVAFRVIPKNSVDRLDAINFIKDTISPNSNLFTDGASIYKKIGNWWPVTHEYERHNRFEFKITSEIEGLWATFFTFIRRTYHHVKGERVEDYLLEFQARFCHPEWFQSPVDNLRISLSKLTPVKTRKTIKNPIIFSLNSTPVFALTLAKKQGLAVPCSY